ncbi:nuclear transport factor 2 family protein [Wenzhouxiangella sp. AB-CW3]|uniref:nuclear transport factor 2 family protein n=1 Tax=Wenzhouxiangella sp. AB-CW3 TaxID=2771012 RepID=UPI00168B96C1|nr:nuclear transport factor 2 family protein [Wenzhouxiangella sp. AB-CW3]QOC22724.1 nuclear transport factor 2 family protein [Wenzhouxiangella sp. AB-CW3]
MNDIRTFLREFNEYWVRPDAQAILDNVTDDFRFSMAGGRTVSGKADFKGFLKEMGSGGADMALDIASIIVEGERAAAHGEISMTDEQGRRRVYAFCDIYRLASGKVAELTAYVVEINGNDKY